MSKVTRYKINTEKYLAFLYTYNEKSERETKEIIPITIVRKRIKYIGLNLHEKTQKTYLQKTVRHQWKKLKTRQKDIPCSWIGRINTLKIYNTQSNLQIQCKIYHIINDFIHRTRMKNFKICINSVHFSCSVLSDYLWPHGLQHARYHCPSPNPGVCSNICPPSQWCNPTISSYVIPFSSYLQSFPASGSFPMSQFFASCGQSIGVSASASVLRMNIQDWFPLGLTGLISLKSKELLRDFSNTTDKNHQFFGAQFSL